MEEFKVKRSDVEEKLKELTKNLSSREEIKLQIRIWLENEGCGELEKRQILNDLTSYTPYLSLVN